MVGLVMSVELLHKPGHLSCYPLEKSLLRCLQIFLLYGVLLIANSNANGLVWMCHILMNVARRSQQRLD